MIRKIPMLFSAPMVVALLNGTKTETRRIGKYQKDDATELGVEYAMHATKGDIAQATYRAYPNGGTARWALCESRCIPGVTIFVKETFYAWGKWVRNGLTKKGKPAWRFKMINRDQCLYVAGGPPAEPNRVKRTEVCWHKRPAIFMPRKFSRISLLVKQVKCERLQDITEESAVSEGITFRMSGTRILWRDYNASSETCVISMNPVDSYRTLWDSINKDHPWESNPWVWVYRFERIANERKEL